MSWLQARCLQGGLGAAWIHGGSLEPRALVRRRARAGPPPPRRGRGRPRPAESQASPARCWAQGPCLYSHRQDCGGDIARVVCLELEARGLKVWYDKAYARANSTSARCSMACARAAATCSCSPRTSSRAGPCRASSAQLSRPTSPSRYLMSPTTTSRAGSPLVTTSRQCRRFACSSLTATSRCRISVTTTSSPASTTSSSPASRAADELLTW
jgi:hypothetical protein